MINDWKTRITDNLTIFVKSPDGEEFIIRQLDSLNIFQNPTIKSIADRMDIPVKELQKHIIDLREKKSAERTAELKTEYDELQQLIKERFVS